MKKEWIWLIGLSLCIVLVIPWSVLRWHREKGTSNDVHIRVLMQNGKVENLLLEDYLIGVVAAEMPADFELEALKAQAIAARTYAAKRLSQKNLPDMGYDVDTTVQTQAWLSDDQMKEKWGWFNYWHNKSRLQKAVSTTRGQVLIFNGEYIDAFYHSSSGRKVTERSEEVWNTSRPYLQNVSSEEVNKLRYVKTFNYTAQELSKKLGTKEFSSLGSSDFQVLTRTSAGRAKSVRMLGKIYTAAQLRILLGLPSTDIEWVVRPESLLITAYGNGHAVGMSQWGANDMAKQNKTANEILAHFYPGTKLLTLVYGSQ